MDAIDPHALFFHVRIFLGMIVSLALAHLVRAMSQVIEQRHRKPLYWIHIVWVVALFVFLLHFWWWELRLSQYPDWRFHIFVFLALYSLLLFFLTWILLPDHVGRYAGFRELYYARRFWFFGGLAVVYLIDFADTAMKGPEFFASLGTEYWIRNLGFMACSVIAMSTCNAIFHGMFAVVGLFYQITWITRMYERLH